MNERLLQYIWQQQLFNKAHLKTLSGEKLLIIHPGTINHNQGPDFLHATIKVGHTRWVGNIELHVFSSHWKDHGHEKDPFYNNVILHVVWIDDKSLRLRFPTLELADRVPKTLLDQYEQLSGSADFIPCGKVIGNIPRIVIDKTFERCFAERLEFKAKEIADLLLHANGHWDEISWWMLAKHFGQPVNSLAFFELAKSINWTIILKHRHNLVQLEALLFGQARLLYVQNADPYIRQLQMEYRFLRKKWKLQPIHFPLKFLRMRPANFPTVRIAQLAALIHREHALFARLINLNNQQHVFSYFDVETSGYWKLHYRPGDEELSKSKKTGKAFCRQLIINLIAPLKFCYGLMHKNDKEKYESVNFLSQLPPEDNIISRNFIKMNINPVSAAETQAMIHLKQQYCNRLNCLKCAIGHHLLKSGQDSQE